MAEDTRSGEARPSVSATDLRTFLIADLRGYTRFTREHGDEAASRVATRFAAIVGEVVPGFGGELLEVRGDEALCVFGSARQALRASVALQRVLRTPPETGEVFPLAAGMGLDAGEAVPTDGGYRGDALNLAARLCSIAKPGQILVSETVVGLARRVEGLRLVERRPVRLKGIEKPVRLVEVVPDEPLPALPKLEMPRSRGRRLALLGGVLAVLAAAIGAWTTTRGSSHRGQASAAVRVRPNSMAVINAATDRVVADVPMRLRSEAAYGASSPAVAYGDGLVWTYDGASQTLWRINARTLSAQRFGLGVDVSDLTTTPGHLWVAAGHVVTDRSPANPTTAVVPIPLPHTLEGPGLAAGRGKIWASAGGEGVAEIDLRSHRVVRIRKASWNDAAASGRQVWILIGGSTIRDLFPSAPGQSTITLSRSLPTGEATDLQLGYGSVWYAAGNTIWKIAGTPPLTVLDKFSASLANAIAVGAGAVWIVDAASDQVLRINPYTDAVRRIPVGTALGGIAVGGGRVWVAAPG